MGANTLRWNAFLKGLDFTWEAQPADVLPTHLVSGLREGCFDALLTGLDLAANRGLLVQVVLSTAHFLRFGYGGEGAELHEIVNRDRVAHCVGLFATERGMNAYIQAVLDPLLTKVQGHPALLGFLVVNEGYAMVRKEDSVLTRPTDGTIQLVQLQRWVNRVTGHIRRALPGALLSASLKLRVNTRWNERNDVHGIGVWYSE